MNILYIDAFSGVSGDKMVAALLSLGANKDLLLKSLSSLEIKDEFKVDIVDKNIMGIISLKFNVIKKKDSHHHRHLNDILKIINNSSITDNAKNIAIEIFKILGQAEAKVHNMSIDDIHFHEIGAVDSIVDIISVACLIDSLKIDKIYSSIIPVGCGFVKAAHGILPVPAPATIEILKNIPVYGTEIKSELTTPTGASILKHLVKDYIKLPVMNIKKIGYGAGDRNLDIPNILRLYLGEKDNNNFDSDYIVSLQTNIDDCTPEQLGFLSNKLLQKGALDVFITPIVMKKTRQAQLLTVLCLDKDRILLENEIFLNSTTFGIRRTYHQRSILRREKKIIKVEGIEVKIKLGWHGDELIQTSIEYESIKEAAEKLGLSYNEVVKKINKAL
ncbi:MAG: nickel pincer cofactor biosynthesis protein LarC [Spirochaetes bacterium]|nr:nickel pincer cofactor biosynthesis protein LarC [Spirochaetota bacterium]